MADDSILRSYRSNEPTRRTGAPAAPRDAGGGDPLAELARLIGQNDSFAEQERTSGQSAEARPRTDSAPSDWRKTAAALARESMRDAPPDADPRFEQVNSAIAAARSLRASPDDQFAHPASHSSHAAFDQAAIPHGGYADSSYDDQPHVDDRLHDPHDAAAPQGGHENENYFFDGVTATPTDDRLYDDPPRARATNGLLTVIVLVGCGILGTAAAYGYRTYYSGARPTDAPIIAAEKLPNKMVPAPPGGDSQSGKSIQERLGAANERVVTRQEEPVTLSDPNSQRGVLPAPFTTSPGPGPSVQSGPAAPSGAATEPKKVKTVPIRPEGGDPMSRPVTGVGSPPLQTSPSIGTTRQPPAAKSVTPPARSGGGPLSLEPQGQTADAASSYQAAPRERAASAPRVAAVSTPASGGGYVVQISSQRSEADAQASFRSLQSKFPKELGDRAAIVRRADLGEKGVYFRAMVGPFGTAGDADQFCGSLKSAGGQCIVQKN
jgi:SPOR domain